ncbi:preprotein translocase subunit YajC [Acidiferrimicrobium sp. IK]|uniref:preprotein translocase subunit YajC n=1 Tax=Acidiferrimicrobium sp. IK TaxID=2871700 RepID=UPI0021CB065E|nr:preprotein translocase subunit YajC [Acidiferrimicrobium sp. IK]MCU4184850.1 preprotein translocase subunit YajC [Acidiferrimicrobium sp. IK]
MTFHLLLAATSPTTTASSKSSGSSYGFLIIILVLVAFYFLIIRPRSQRQRQARTQAATLDVGDAVMSVGGIKGVVVGIDDDGDVRVEVSPGVILTFVRRAINAQPAPANPPADDAPPGVFHDEDDSEHHRTDEGDGPDDRPGTGTESY